MALVRPRARENGGGAGAAARRPAGPGVECPRRATGWVKDLGRIIGHEDAREVFDSRAPLPEQFADVERHQVEWTNYPTPQALIDLVASRSYCITSPEKV